MRRGMLIALATLAMLAVPTPGHTLTGTLEKINDSSTLTLGYRTDVPPMSSTGADGQPVGYSIDLCQEIAGDVQQALKRPDLKVRWVPVTAENRVDAVANGTVDIECGVTTNTLSREERVDFTLITFIDGASVLVAEGAGIGGVTDLGGKRIAVVSGTTTEKVVTDVLRVRAIEATVVHVKDHDEGLAALEASKVDAYVSDRVILIGLALRVRGTKRLALLPDLLSYEPYGFMVRRDDSAFRLVVNRTLARVYRSGAIGRIYAKWFGALGKPSAALILMYAIQSLPE